MTNPVHIRTGRERSRWICPGCHERIMVGEPRATVTWPAQLTLTPDQVKLLLIAAAEYAELSEEAGEWESAVGFVDWMAVDALRGEKWVDPLISEGAKARNINGGVAVIQHQGNTHRDPFPLPIQSNGVRHTKGRRAG